MTTPELRDLVDTVRSSINDGLERLRESDEAKIPVGLEDAAGDRYGLITDARARELKLRVQRVVIVLEPAP